uniref:G-protein coupled receptors family 1 profile domain-containing protein n=1 Tax=Panagrolaimus sp. JU765 TaxID=591449 RepID=A0AC34RQ54_9BILA
MKPMIIAISIDRCLAVFKPVRYAKNDSKTFPYTAAVISVVYSIFNLVLSRIGLDSAPINVCSAGATTTPWNSMSSQIQSYIFFVLLILFYFLALTMTIIRLKAAPGTSNERRQSKAQIKIFLTVSWVLFTCFLAYGVPTILNWAGKVFDLGPDISSYSAIYSGFASGIMAAINVYLYLFKHNEIHRCFMLWLSDNIPKSSKMFRISKTTNFSHTRISAIVF